MSKTYSEILLQQQPPLPPGPTWRIIAVSKWLVTPIYKPFRPFGRGTTLLRGLTNHGYQPLTNWDDPPISALIASVRYYEIAYHDSTQPRRWPVRASCQRSVKSQRPGDPKNYKEKWRVSGFPADCFHKSLIPFRFRSRQKSVNLLPIPSMGLVYLPTFTIKIDHPCR